MRKGEGREKGGQAEAGKGGAEGWLQGLKGKGRGRGKGQRKGQGRTRSMSWM